MEQPIPAWETEPNAEAIFVYTNEEESARALREFKKQGYDKPIIGETTLTGQKVSNLGEVKIYANSHYVTPRPTMQKAIQQIKAGLLAIYVSGWQVAADANDAGQMYPDQSLYPADSVPNLVRRINQALQRAAILSNEKFRGVRLVLGADQLKIICTNSEQEEAEEELEIDYKGEALDIGFNITYLLDVLHNLATERVLLAFGDANSSALITMPDRGDYKYVVMPMRI